MVLLIITDKLKKILLWRVQEPKGHNALPSIEIPLNDAPFNCLYVSIVLYLNET